MQRGTLVTRSVGGAVLLVGLVVALLPGGEVPGTGTGRGAPSLPDRVAGYSHLTTAVSSSPPGRALALFQFGYGVEFLDFPQAVVVGADGDVARRVDLAEDSSWPQTQGDPAPMLLSPDGTRVAVGDADADTPEVAVVDLATGAVQRHPVPPGRRVIPLAWSPDGRRLAYLGTAFTGSPLWDAQVDGDVGLLELDSGQAAALPGATGVQAVAFAPDSSELALQRSDAAGGGLDVVPLDGGGAGRTLPLAAGHHLDGAAAWSPDGALLATSSSGEGIAFVDATGASRPTPGPLDRGVAGPGPVLGWTAPDHVVVLLPDPPDADPDRHRLLDVPLDGAAPRQVSEVPTSDASYGVARFQLATALLPGIEVREAGDVDRGRWPLALRLGVALALAVLAAGATALLVRLRR